MGRLLGVFIGFFAFAGLLGMGAGGALFLGIAGTGGYGVWELRRHPMVDCRGCRGRGRIYSGVFRRHHHNHAPCNGRGRGPARSHGFLTGAGLASGRAHQSGPGWARRRRQQGTG